MEVVMTIKRPKEFCTDCPFSREMTKLEKVQSGQIFFCDLFWRVIPRNGNPLRSRPLRICKKNKKIIIK
jgi:hypothetical protein